MKMEEYLDCLHSDIRDLTNLEADGELTECDAVELEVLDNVKTVLEKEFSDYDLIVYECQQMAKKLEELGYSDEQISNICNNSSNHIGVGS